MEVKLYNDSETFNKEYPASTSIEDIKRDQGIVGRHRLVSEYSNVRLYRVDNSGFKFSIVLP